MAAERQAGRLELRRGVHFQADWYSPVNGGVIVRRWPMIFLIVVASVVVVSLALAGWYDHRERRRGERVNVTLKRPWILR